MNRNEYITGISTIIKDFRQGELTSLLDYNHVKRWIDQFEENEKDIILGETFQILVRYYFKKEKIIEFVKHIIKDLASDKDLESLEFLCVQDAGYSQKIIMEYVSEIYDKSYGSKCNISNGYQVRDVNHYIYIDDGLYTGRKVKNDLKKCIDIMPEDSKLDVYLMIVYSNAFDYIANTIKRYGEKKQIEVNFIYGKMFFNDRNNREHPIDFIWPDVSLRNDTEIFAYEEILVSTGKANYIYQNTKRKQGIFTSTANSRVVEYAFLRCGIQILKKVKNTSFRPLGISNTPSFGFGSFCATDLNISNTCPLVLWWGSIEGNQGDALDCWYPLLPRRGNEKLLQIISETQKYFSVHSYIDVLRTVHSLSIDRYNEVCLQEKNRKNSVISLAEIREYRDRSNLLQYLKTLDMNAIKMVEVVMYIGRDYQIDISEEDLEYEAEMKIDDPEYQLPARTFKVRNPDELIRAWLDDFEGVSGWKNKSIEIEQIYQKVPLYRYLERAFEILGI